MKKTILILIIALASNLFAYSNDNKIDSLMNIYSQQTNLDKFNEVKSLEIEGEMQVGPDLYYFRLQYKKPNSFRHKERFKDVYVYKLINDNELTVLTKDGKIDMSVMERDVIMNMVSYMEGFLINHKKNDYKLKYLGLGNVSWTPENTDISIPFTPISEDLLPKGQYHIIEITTRSSEVDKVYLDPTTFDIRFSTDNPFMFAKLGPVKFDDYQKIGDISFPFRIEIFSPMFPAVFRLNKIELDKDFPDEIFKSDSPENIVIPGQ